MSLFENTKCGAWLQENLGAIDPFRGRLESAEIAILLPGWNKPVEQSGGPGDD